MPTVSRAQLEAMPGFDASFHLGEKPASPSLPPTDGDEKHFQADILREARSKGWLCYHTQNSRKSQPGFPDLVMIRGCFMIVAELKVGKNRIEPGSAQEEWMLAFESVAYESNERVRYFCWRPEDWPEILKVLA